MPLIIRRHNDWMPKLLALAAVLLAGTMPWIVGTGLYSHPSRIPRAWPSLQMPADLLRFTPFNLWYLILGALVFLVVFLVTPGTVRGSLRVAPPLRALGPVLLLTMTWTVVGYAIFLLLVPAASFFPSRLKYSYWGPILLLSASGFTALARMLLPRAGTAIRCITAAALMLGVYLTAHSSRPAAFLLHLQPVPGSGSWDLYQEICRYIDGMRLDSGTRIYGSPNDHLVLTFYSGLPVQDITPVRKSFLESYKGDIVYIDLGPMHVTHLLDPERIREAALKSGQYMSIRDAQETSVLLNTRHYRQTIGEIFAPGQPPDLEPVPIFLRPLLETHHTRVTDYFSRREFFFVTAGQDINNWFDWRTWFKYLCVDLDTRRGRNTNFAQRLRNSDAVILSRSGIVAVFHSRWHPPLSTAPVKFRIIR